MNPFSDELGRHRIKFTLTTDVDMRLLTLLDVLRFCDSTREIPGEVQMRARKDEGLLHQCVYLKSVN